MDMDRFNASYSSENHFSHELENGVDLDRMHQEETDLHSYLVMQHMNTPPDIDSHSHIDPSLIDDPNGSSYYMNGNSYIQEENDEVIYVEEEDRKPEIKKEIIPENEILEDISIDEAFKESDEGRVHLTSEYIKCVQEAKKTNRCFCCNAGFKKLDQTIEHLQVEHFTDVYNYRYNCLNCRVAYKSTRKFNIHKTEIHNEAELFKCLDCNNKIISKFRVYKHLVKNRQCRKTSIKLVQTHSIDRANVENVCLDCRRVFKNVSSLSNHIKSCDGKIQVPVEPQPQNQQQQQIIDENLRRSIRNMTQGQQSSPPKRQPTCRYCNEKQIANIEKHEDTCRRKICPKCSKVFTTTRNTIRHLRNIHNVPKHKIHSLFQKNEPIISQNPSAEDQVEDEEEEVEEDEDVVLAVDCCTHEELPLKRHRIA